MTDQISTTRTESQIRAELNTIAFTLTEYETLYDFVANHKDSTFCSSCHQLIRTTPGNTCCNRPTPTSSFAIREEVLTALKGVRGLRDSLQDEFAKLQPKFVNSSRPVKSSTTPKPTKTAKPAADPKPAKTEPQDSPESPVLLIFTDTSITFPSARIARKWLRNNGLTIRDAIHNGLEFTFACTKPATTK